MELIIDRKLNDEEKKLISEITKKKLRMKKSTISDKQRIFTQQLAIELLKEHSLQAKLKNLTEELTKKMEEYELIVAREKYLLESLKA